MAEVVKIVCENLGSELHVNMGATLYEVSKMLPADGKYPFLACYVNNKYQELSYKVYGPVSLRFIDITHFEGIRVYQRTLFFTLNKAVHDLFPGKTLIIKHSVSNGFYCEIEGMEDIDQHNIDLVKVRMNELVAQDIPIVKQKMLTSEALQLYGRLGFSDKLDLINSRPSLYVKIYGLADMVGYFYGVLAPSTGFLHLYDLKKYYKGFYLSVPRRRNPDLLEPMIDQEMMFDIFTEYKAWVNVMGVSTVGSLNQRILKEETSDLVKVAEAFHEKKMGSIADRIALANKTRKARLVLIAGPSSSGKTTFAKRLGIQLRIVGLNPVLISLDDYFVDRASTPVDETGEYDYESLEAIDVNLFNDHLKQLLDGGSVDVPRYDFITGKRQYHESPLKLDDRSILVIEGIHGLNPKLTEEVDNSFKFKVYISALTSISLDNLSRISTTDSRLIRRTVRDYTSRGSDATATFRRWESVRKGEEKHIFPFQENADVMFNSSLFYETSVLRRYVEPMLLEVPDTEPEYGEARRMLKFLENFTPIDPDQIPPTSILREFIGGSSFKY